MTRVQLVSALKRFSKLLTDAVDADKLDAEAEEAVHDLVETLEDTVHELDAEDTEEAG